MQSNTLGMLDAFDANAYGPYGDAGYGGGYQPAAAGGYQPGYAGYVTDYAAQQQPAGGSGGAEVFDLQAYEQQKGGGSGGPEPGGY